MRLHIRGRDVSSEVIAALSPSLLLEMLHRCPAGQPGDSIAESRGVGPGFRKVDVDNRLGAPRIAPAEDVAPDGVFTQSARFMQRYGPSFLTEIALGDFSGGCC